MNQFVLSNVLIVFFVSGMTVCFSVRENDLTDFVQTVDVIGKRILHGEIIVGLVIWCEFWIHFLFIDFTEIHDILPHVIDLTEKNGAAF